MKYIINESRIEKIIMDYLDKNFIPDYGWVEDNRNGSYQEDVDRFGDLVFFINDVDSYAYYGCNSGKEYDKDFEPSGRLDNYKCPLLSVYPTVSEQLSDWFGDMWKPIFKKWFEQNTGLSVSQLTDDYI